MAIKKKVVWLPYDMDTAIGINNEGELAFDYSLEDTDTVGTAEVYNGQDSVIWNNIRLAFADELAAMYKTLRSEGKISYALVERMFEEHQGVWPEALVNEDSQFKYLDPLLNPDAGTEADATYLPMLQGLKTEQRKWWLFNRIKYIDSKYNAGDALTDFIDMRLYARSNVTITPYADIYPTAKFGSYLVTERGHRNVPTTLICPAGLDNPNDTEFQIYSASQLADVGDLSGFYVGRCNISMATKLQSLKIGDSASTYSNTNLKQLTLGSNVLLRTLDVRNCPNLAQAVDVSNCTNIENIYFDGTAITGCQLPNGGILKVLHLPSTVVNLDIRNQTVIQDLVVTVANLESLRLENTPTLDSKSMVNSLVVTTEQVPTVRITGFYWEFTNATEIEAFLDKLDTMKGLDINGNELPKPYLEGTIHTASLTGAQIASYKERYPYLNVIADHTTSYLTYKTWDGSSTISTVECYDGVPQSASPSIPVRTATMQYNYTAVGWNRNTDAQTDDPSAITNVTEDRTVYAAYSRTVRSHTITFVRGSTDGGGTLQSSDYPYGSTPVYSGATPTTTQGDAEDYPFEGWSPTISTVTGPTTYTAVFGSPIEDVEITDSWDTIIANIDNGTYKTAYKIGNYKPLDLGTEGTVNMQIVAMDADELASGGTAPLTFIAKELLANRHSPGAPWTVNNSYGIKKYLDETIAPLMPSNVYARVNTVKKYRTAYSGDTRTDDNYLDYAKLWIPSGKNNEIVSSNLSGMYNPTYKKIYSSNGARKKIRYGQTYTEQWLTRDAAPSNQALAVDSNGDISKYVGATTKAGVCLGFCLGLESETITDSWSEIFAAEQDGTYSTKYSIGDTKMLDLGTEGQHLMEIVAFDTDDKADGSGKAKITWISKDLLPTTHAMNATQKTVDGETALTAGGWEHSDMRDYLKTTIKPLIPQTVRDAIVPVTKVSSTYTGGTFVKDGQTTTDDVWIPGHREIFNRTWYESTGAVYSGKFIDAKSRIKKRSGSESWWLRVAESAGSFRYVGIGGDAASDSAYIRFGIALGFCT